MQTYEINIAKMYTASDWRGLPAHKFHARLQLDDALSEADAMAELERLKAVYTWPEFHQTLRSTRVVRQSTHLAGNADPDFLKAHGWEA